MTGARLFTPAGPAVTPAEAAGRRAANLAAQATLALDDALAGTPAPCPACSSTDPAHACHAVAGALFA